MKNSLIGAIALICTSALSAQNAAYSPPWLASTEGALYSYQLGYYSGNSTAGATYQMVDGELGNLPMTLKEVATRLDSRNYTSSTAGGRTWKEVTLKVGDGDLATFSNNFANNRKGTQTQVFKGSVTWPSFTGTPVTKPALWGGVSGSYRWPFSTNYPHTGQSDLLLEFHFTGGTLANSVTWSTTSARSYYFDSFGSPTNTVGSTYQNIPATRLNGNGTCNDSAMTTSTGAYAYAIATVYPKYYSIHNYRNKMLFYHYSYYTAPGAPVMHGFALSNNKTGLDLGTGCNKLHLTGPLAVIPMMTLPKAVNTSGYTGYLQTFIPWSSALANIQFTLQAAWADSVTNQFKLTQARQVTTPASGPTNVFAKRSGTYSSTSATTGVTPQGFYYRNPALRYIK